MARDAQHSSMNRMSAHMPSTHCSCICLFLSLFVLATFSARTRENARSCSDILRTKMSCVIDDNSSACDGDKHEAYDDHPVRVLVCVRACGRISPWWQRCSLLPFWVRVASVARCFARVVASLVSMFVCSAYACAHGTHICRAHVCEAAQRTLPSLLSSGTDIGRSGTDNGRSGTAYANHSPGLPG